jgi:polyhydroxybutyrate depolymerase
MMSKQQTKAAKEERIALEVGGRTRTMIVVPGRAPGGRAVLAFHGSNQKGAVLRSFAGGSLDALNAYGPVAYLDGYRRDWNGPRRSGRLPTRRENIDDIAFARAAVRELAGRYGTSEDQFYAVGYSSGGVFVLRLLLEAASELAGAATISATMPVSDDLLDIDRGPYPVPTALIHGTADRLVPYNGGMASLWGLRPRGLGISAMDTAQLIATRNGNSAPPTTTEAPELSDGRTRVNCTRFEASQPLVVLYTVESGGHTIPGPKRALFIMGRTARGASAAAMISDVWGPPENAVS